MGENPFHGNQVSLHMGTPYKIRVWFCTILRTPSTSLCSISILFAVLDQKRKRKSFDLSINGEKLFGMELGPAWNVSRIQNHCTDVALIIYEPRRDLGY